MIRLVLIALLLSAPTAFADQTGKRLPSLIRVDLGPYSCPEQAAGAHDTIDWSGADPERTNACTEAFAALELRHYLNELADGTQRDLYPVLPLSEPLGPEGLILSNLSRPHRPAAVDSLIRSMELERRLGRSGSFALVPAEKQFFIIGRDRIGTLYGAYHLLHLLGMRWYAPGADGEAISRHRVLRPPGSPVIRAPAFATRGFWAWEDRADEPFYLWMARNGLNLWTIAARQHGLLHKLGILLTAGGHLHFQRFLDPEAPYPYDHPLNTEDDDKPEDPYRASEEEYRGDKNGDGRLSYFEAHPEWYGLVKGRRETFSGDFGTNICTSNRGAVDELCRNLVDELAHGEWRDATLLNFWPLDHGRWCECERCTALGEPTDRLLRLAHQVRSSILKAVQDRVLQHDVEVIFPIYQETLAPPTRPLPENFDCIGTLFPIRRCYAHPLDAPECTEYNGPIWDQITQWSSDPQRLYRGELFMGEYYNVMAIASLPVLLTQIMSHDIPLYFRLGIRHCHYMHVYTRDLGMKRINNYLFARLLWDPETDVNAVMDEYFDFFYGSAAPQMARLYRKFEFAMSSITQWKHSRRSLASRINGPHFPLFITRHLQLTESHPENNDAVDLEQSVRALRECRMILRAVLKNPDSERLKRRLIEDDVNLRYASNTAALYYHFSGMLMAFRKGDINGAREQYRLTLPHAARLRAETRIVASASSHANSKNGLEASRIAGTYRRWGKRLGYDFDQLAPYYIRK